MLILSFALVIAAVVACLIIWRQKRMPSDKIQLMMFAVLCANMVLFWAQIKVFTDDAILRQRPFLSADVETEIVGAGEKVKFQDLDSSNEIKLITRFENEGLSPAFVDSIQGRAFYAYFEKDEGETEPSIRISILSGVAEKQKEIDLDGEKDFPVKMENMVGDAIIMPHRSLRFVTLINADVWKKKLFTSFNDYPAMVSVPVFVQIQYRYRDSQGNPYHQNNIFFVSWYRANYISPSVFSGSNDRDAPHIFSMKTCFETVARIQGVDFKSLKKRRIPGAIEPKHPNFNSGVQVVPSPNR